MKRIAIVGIISLGWILALVAPLYSTPANGSMAELPAESVRNLESVIQEAIAHREVPGAVVWIGHQGRILYRQAFGHRALAPQTEPMTLDTIFDLASLTKVVATTSAVMKLAEQGRIRLSERVSIYIPEFKGSGKERITVRQLLTHYSGLRDDLNMEERWSGYEATLSRVWLEIPLAPPDDQFQYSDIGFAVLGELVQRVSGERLDAFAAKNIFAPLGMKTTAFNPPAGWRPRIAPTERINARWFRKETAQDLWLRGEVHDPTAYRMGGVAGHAGLFSTAEDLAVFAETLLNLGAHRSGRVFSPLAVLTMTSPQSPPGKPSVRGYGWDIATSYSTNRGDFFPPGSYGHTGYTGTSLWIDPTTHTYVILLTNRVHPDGKGDAVPLRSKVANIIAAAFTEVSRDAWLAAARFLGDTGARLPAPAKPTTSVLTGIDVLRREKFARLQGRRIGLITNHTGLDRTGQSTIDLLFKAPGMKLVALFSPEHGLRGSADAAVASGTDTKTGLPIHSLYGKENASRRPSALQLKDIDLLVYDIQDVGARFYTYTTTMGYALEAAAQNNIKILILDRPNPIGGEKVEGPLLDIDRLSFTGYFTMPVRHGMTMGEMARMFNQENRIGADLEIVPMMGWQRSLWYDMTYLPWTNPSPNIRSLAQATLYPGIGTLETTNVSVGRGTDAPFEQFGAPYIDGVELAAYLNRRHIPGVRFMPIDFTPQSSVFKDRPCSGVRIDLVDRQALDSVRLGLEVAGALHKLYPKKWEIEKYIKLTGSTVVLKALEQGVDPKVIQANWEEELARFRKMREKYLMYP
ncbi:MAG: DUF1343 domain-containing protein [Acidobacteria bacterium]|nr:DUF1343 domain-containing protein [Acidobacteriota bacterium]